MNFPIFVPKGEVSELLSPLRRIYRPLAIIKIISMKQKSSTVIILLMTILLNSLTFAQNTCLSGTTTFYNQASIDNFLSNYPDCTEIDGNIRILGNDINNLAAFSNIISINGYLSIRTCDALPNLDGLNNLTSIGGRLYIDQNASLNSISALNNLTTIGDGLTIRICDALPNLDGLNNLTSIGGELLIDQNASLNSISALNNLTTIGGGLTIRICDVLPNLDGLNNVTTIGGNLLIERNPKLSSIASLNSLTSINGRVNIHICNMLTNLDGLNNVLSINGFLSINNNNLLKNIYGIQNIDPNTIENSQATLPDLSIYNNPLLSVCAVESICDFLSLPNKTHSIYNNASGCNNSSEIIYNCSSGFENINNNEKEIVVFPNPTNKYISFNFSSKINLKKVLLLNTIGMVIKEINLSENKIDISKLADGLYLFLFFTDNGIIQKKVIKIN